MAPPVTKRKTAAKESVKTLSSVLAAYKAEWAPRVFFSKEALLEWFKEDQLHLYSLFLSSVVHGPRTTSFTVPDVFQRFDVTRGKDHKVNLISDNDSSIGGQELATICLIQNVQANGYDYAYFSMDKPTWMLGFKRVMCNVEVVEKKDEDDSSLTRIFTFDAQTACYAAPETVYQMLSYGYTKVEDFKSIAIATSGVAKDGHRNVNLDFSDAVKLSAQLKKSEALNSVQSLAQTLYASHLKDLDLEGKIQAFIANPSPRLASLIDLKMPTKLQLCFTSSKSAVQPVPLGNLSEDDSIILSNVAISQEFYQQVTVAQDVQVVKYVKNLSVKNRNQKLTPLKEPETMKVKDFLRIASAIADDNKASGTAAHDLGPSATVDNTALAAFFQS